jgi:Flp pilus assembly protein TadD
LDEAENSYLQATRLKLDHVGALSNLAVIYATRGDLKRAIPLIERSITHYPNDRNLYLNLIMMCESAGEIDKAAEYRRKLQMLQGP